MISESAQRICNKKHGMQLHGGYQWTVIKERGYIGNSLISTKTQHLFSGIFLLVIVRK